MPGGAAIKKRGFVETAARIHRTLVITPSVPKIVPMKVEEDDAADKEGGADVLKNEGGAEMPFVPASERGTVKTDEVDDSIVVVGQAKRKKRKRAGEKAGGGTSSASGAADKGEEDEPADFDYGAVSNILDDGSDHEGREARGGRKKQRQEKGE